MPTKDNPFKFDFSDLVFGFDLSKTTFTSKESYTVSRILKSGPYTHVFWEDGTKTTVRRSPDEPDNDYAAFTAALAIKMYGSNSALKRMLKQKVEVQKPKGKKQDAQTYKAKSFFDLCHDQNRERVNVMPYSDHDEQDSCEESCPIDYDAIYRNLAEKAAASANKALTKDAT